MTVHGTVHRGFESVREVFADVIADAAGGCAFSVVRRGEVLVGLWGGPSWHEDSLIVLFSGTKGIVATLVAMLVDRDELDPDERVAVYWPEFAAAGKQDVLLSQVLSHTVGLPYVDPEPEGEFVALDNDVNAKTLAAQSPLWTPGSRVAYHALTYGYLLAEILRRVTGRSVGTLARELLAEPYGLDLHLGLPTALDARVARLVKAPDYRISTFLHDPVRRAIVERMYRGILDSGDLPNTHEYRRAELAGGGALGTAPAMAKLYDLLATGGLVSPSTLATSTRTWSAGPDVINDRPLRFGLGFELADDLGTYGPATVAFGHSGAGGGRHGAWPDADLGFSFTTAELRSEDADGRADHLLATLHPLV
ncbi:MAG: penicillin-binding protein [Amycolatopsis sp.]|uniref:serine hydrolase domain-containing protein n=1 Tax=Amycolatopsis sp. TaxID=37632 RepID=UPI00262FB511|nr:serine hydrolase domain-containing protein [Amycolatopsis sp.]MCU1686524.1 penicillin-binding protein [Amycolatopsis sp.]